MVSVQQKHVDVPIIETVERVVDVPTIKQVMVPHITTIEKRVEVPHTQVVEKMVEVPMVGEDIQGNQHHVHAHLPVQREQHPAEVIHHHEVGMPFETHYAGEIAQDPATMHMPMEPVGQLPMEQGMMQMN
jgi:hypothetical protein